MRRFRGNQRGHAMLEFAVASALLIGCLTGTWQFGYTFYLYDQLQSAVNDGGRYAAMRTYRCANGDTDINKVKTAIKNMVVYGSPSPANGAAPLVRGLATSNVAVTYTLSSGIPTDVTVNINAFTVDAIFKTFTFTGKPTTTYAFLGRYAPNESEP
jgi:Flp pilus assembly protein TadG